MPRDKRVQQWIEQRDEMYEKVWEIDREIYGKKRDADRLAKEAEARELGRNAAVLEKFIRGAGGVAW